MSIAAFPPSDYGVAEELIARGSKTAVLHPAEAAARTLWGLTEQSSALSWDPASARRWASRRSRRQMTADTLSVMVATAAGASAAIQISSAPAVQGMAGAFLFAVVWMLALALRGVYDHRPVTSTGLKTRRAVGSTCAVFGLLASLSLLTGWEQGRAYLLVAMPLGLAFLILTRWRAWFPLAAMSPAAGASQVLVAGEVAKTEHVVTHLRKQGSRSGYIVSEQVVLPHLGDEQLAQEPALSAKAVDDVVDAATSSGVDAVIIADSDMLNPRALQELGWNLAALDVSLLIAPCLTDVAGSRLRAQSVAGMPLMHVDYPRLQGSAAFVKRAFDIVFSLSAIAVILPVLAVVALMVRLDSRGPVLFHQERVGREHSLFTMLKFRSMVSDAEKLRANLLQETEGNGVLFKIRRDPRVTRVGRVLRRYSLDELPQFFNVLRGEMSVVGPRPPLPGEVDTYDERADRRLLVKPGITGLWQIQGRSDLNWEDSLRLDLYYVENWSVWSDMGIVLRTVRAVVTGSGAY